MNNKGGSLFSKLAGGGILGILLFIILLPVFILIAIFGGIYLLYFRWKMKRAIKKMSKHFGDFAGGAVPGGSGAPNDILANIFAQMKQGSAEMPPEDEPELTPEGRKKVKVTTVKQEPGKIDTE